MRTLYTPDRELDTNADGIALIKRWEAFEPEWYLCPAEVWTIGYGLTEDVIPRANRRQMPGPITEAEASAYLETCLALLYEPAVEAALKVRVTENEFAALVSFAYNVSAGAFRGSTLLKLLNRGDRDGAAEQFARWVFADGKRLQGLANRREAEAGLFLDAPEVARIIQATPLPVQRISPHASFRSLPHRLTWRPDKLTA